MSDVPKALEEVWIWKEKIYTETKSMTMREAMEYIRKNARALLNREGYQIKNGRLCKK